MEAELTKFRLAFHLNSNLMMAVRILRIMIMIVMMTTMMMLMMIMTMMDYQENRIMLCVCAQFYQVPGAFLTRQVT